MHRSGTSMLSGVLNLLGYSVGKHQWKPDFFNSKGYFENSKIVEFNDGLLNILHSSWNNSMRIDYNWYNNSDFKEHEKNLTDIIVQEYGQSQRLLLKDPRISILLPLYLEVFKTLDIIPDFIISFRNPMGVYSSLNKRDNISLNKSLLLWADYTLKAEFYSRSFNRILISYQAFLNDPDNCLYMMNERLHLGINLDEESGKIIHGFIDSKLNHSGSHDLNWPENLPSGLIQLFELLNNNDRKNINKNEIQQFELIRKNFTDHCSFFTDSPLKPEAMLHFETSAGKTEIFRYPVSKGKNIIKLNPEIQNKVSSISIIPANQMTVLRINKIAFSENHNETEIVPQFNNALFKDKEGNMYFETELPQIKYFFSQPVEISDFHMDVEYFAFGHATHDYTQKARDLYNKELNEKMKQFEDELVKAEETEKQYKFNEEKLIEEHIAVLNEKNEEVKRLNKNHEQIIKEIEESFLRKESALRSEISNLNKIVESEKDQKIYEIEKLSGILLAVRQEYNRIVKEKEIVINSLNKKLNTLQNEFLVFQQQKIVENHTLALKIKSVNTQKQKAIQESRKNIKLLNERLQKLQKSLKDQEIVLSYEIFNHKKEIQNIRQSITWRVGKILTFPLFLVFRLIRGHR